MTTVQDKVTVPGLAAMKAAGRRIVCLTAYDAAFARVLAAAGVDVVLVGDSLGMVLLGFETTIPVTLEHMVHHAAAVSRAAGRMLRVVDMPFLAHADVATAVAAARRLMQEGGAEMVKLEGGSELVPIVEHLAALGVPVCGHLGLQPQSVHRIGGYRVQARDPEAGAKLLADARALEAAGAGLLVLECVPRRLAAEVTAALHIPVIGIGAGPDVDGQVLVLHDLLGITPPPHPRFVRDFLRGRGSVQDAVVAYVEAVRGGTYPAEGEWYA